MNDEFWQILRSQPGVGIGIVDSEGIVLYSNRQAQYILWGQEYAPTGKSLEQIEGRLFAEERMAVIQEVLEKREPVIISHICRGKQTESVVWPLDASADLPSRVMVIMRHAVEPAAINNGLRHFQSELVDLGALDALTTRELEVLAMIGHGVPQKTVAAQLGITQRTVERNRSSIAQKLGVDSLTELARTVQVAGLQLDHADMPRIDRSRPGQHDHQS